MATNGEELLLKQWSFGQMLFQTPPLTCIGISWYQVCIWLVGG